jgi:hypothetical protein
MSKKYKIVLSALDLGLFEAGLFQARQQIEKFKRDMNQDPAGYQKKIEEMESRLREYDKVVDQIATVTKITTQQAEIVLDQIIKKYEVGTPAIVEFFNTINESAKLLAIEGADFLFFIKKNLDNSTDLPTVAKKIAEDLTKIHKLSIDLGLSTDTVLRLFVEALKLNNFDKIYNLVAIAPLLKIDFKTIGVKNISNIDLSKNALNTIQSVSKTVLDKSTKQILLDKLLKSQHKVEFFYNTVLNNLDILEVDRIVKFNENLKKDIQNNPDYYVELKDSHNRTTGNYQRLRDLFSQVNSQSNLAPGDETQIKKTSIARKIRIVTSTRTEDLQSQYSEIETDYSKIQNSFDRMKKFKVEIENYLKPVEKMGEFLEIVTSVLDPVNTKFNIKSFEMELINSKSLFSKIIENVEEFLKKLPEIEENKTYKNKVQGIENDLKTAKQTQFEQYEIDIQRYKLIIPILDDLKSLDDKIALYNQYKEEIKPKSAKFRVKFNFVDPTTGDVSNATMPRYSFINLVYQIGLDIVSKISSIANRYMGVGGEAGRRSAIRLNKEALKFKTENQNWAENNMDVQAPLVEEFRK